METTEGEYLFGDGFLDHYLRVRASDVRHRVEGIPKGDFAVRDDDELVAEALSDLRIEPLVIDRDDVELSTRDVTLDASEIPGTIAYHFKRGPAPISGTRFCFSVPYVGTTALWRLSPSNRIENVHARGYVRSRGQEGHLELVFTEPKGSDTDFQAKLAAEFVIIDRNREGQRHELYAFNSSLRVSIAQAVADRRKEFGGHEELAKRMGVRLRPGDAVPAAQVTRPTRAVAPTGRALLETRKPPGHPVDSRTWDVFVSYASEDREAVARPLAEVLTASGLKVWFDKFELSLGDRLRRKLDEGLARSRFGVVILSGAFFAKHWPQLELDGLAQREVGGEKVILPVWHGLDRDGVAAYSPTLADRVAAPWSDGAEMVASAILKAVRH